MVPLWLFVVFIGIVATTLVVTSLRKHNMAPADRDWMDSFSVAKYRPMERLLSTADFEFLASQPGYDSSIVRKLRKERRRLFSSYLNSMIRDFKKLHSTATHLALSASGDREEFASTLIKQKFAFQRTVITVRGRLLLYSFGIGKVDITGLVDRTR